ncbi:MAG: hypothetical protein ABR968_08485 [Bacteroidales bacterium]|jgi:hypothetical protein
MGSSHGRMFSRGKNHLNVEKILNKKIINISKTAAGPVPELEFLKYFYDKGNKTKEIWYIIDPYIFYSEKWNEGLFFLTDEPFRFDFFSQIFFSGISTDVKYNYIKSKFSNDWIVNKASRLPDTEVKLYKTDTSAVAKRIKTEYPSGLKKEIFIKYSEELYKILEYSNNKKIKITFIIPPTLLGKVPGMNEMKIYLKDIEKKFHTKYYDYADSLLNPEFYYNHDHLNNAGIEALTKQFLTKIIKN